MCPFRRWRKAAMVDRAQLDAQKRVLVLRLDGWSPGQLAYSPFPNAWSAVQVLDHLVRTEEEILSRARSGLQAPHTIGARDRVGFLFLRRIFESERKVRVPASAAQVLPEPHPRLDAVLERWEKIRADFADFEGHLSPKQAIAGLFRHPVGGWMAVPQIREFFSVHMTHHGFQIERLRAELFASSS